MNLVFIFNSIALGVGLAMDTFSVSIVNALNEPKMKRSKIIFCSFIYSFFQFLMPMTGWICVHTIIEYFKSFQKVIPWIALMLLLYIGGKMIWEAFHPERDDEGNITRRTLTFGILIMQGIATSIDALSVGFTIAEYNLIKALICGLLIAVTTFIISFSGAIIGKQAGAHFSHKSGILGGIILIGIGIEIFVSSMFF